MSILLSGTDVIDLAVQLETQGEAFYRQAGQNTAAPEAAALFAELAEEEARHRETFQGLSSAIRVTEIDPTTWEEAAGYIEATINREFFGPDAPILEAAAAGNDLPTLFRRAIAFEQQTLLFFYTLRDLVQPANRHIIDRIIAEEKRHVFNLAARLDQL
ncbi:MAG TPA: hypothetical protein GX702_02420 [Chloroflexi bacterium]|nr:hypothetical protein [Chloroflexota bacterium]